MTAPLTLLFVSFPTAGDELLHWWLVRKEALISSGIDADPLNAAGLGSAANSEEPLCCIALVPSVLAVVRWHARPADVNQKQALAAATINARAESLSKTNLHVAAIADGFEQIATATFAQDVMASGLVHLRERGIDPDFVVPSGWLVPPAQSGFVEADFGFDKLLRGPRMIAPDEPALRDQFARGDDISSIDSEAMAQLLVAPDDTALLNLRCGMFAKKSSRAMSDEQKRILGWLAAAVFLISIAIPLMQLARYHWAADIADTDALAVAETVLGPESDPDAAEQKLGERLVSETRGNVIFSVPASALFSALQQVPGVSINNLSYRQDGLVAAELSAIRNEDINPALIALQNAGFVITATPRTDATGTAKADITVRAP